MKYKNGYPKEDKCKICGEHLGWILSPVGEMVALGLCEKHVKEIAGNHYKSKKKGNKK